MPLELHEQRLPVINSLTGAQGRGAYCGNYFSAYLRDVSARQRGQDSQRHGAECDDVIQEG